MTQKPDLKSDEVRDAEAELNCAEDVLDALSANLDMEKTDFDCIGEYITAVFEAHTKKLTAPKQEHVESVSMPPVNCRQRLKAEGKVYARSNCQVCGAFAPKWKECNAALSSTCKHALDEKQEQGEADLDAICQDLRDKTYTQAMRISDLEKDLTVAYIRGHEDGKKAANGQFPTMVESSIHAGSGEKIGFPHRGQKQKQEQGEPVAVMELYESGWDLVENIDTDWLETLPFGTKLYTTPPQHKPLTVRLVSYPESNGKTNWTAMFVRTQPWDGLVGNSGGITIDRSEYWNRVSYNAERARFLLGERNTEPSIMAYGKDVKTPEEWDGTDSEAAHGIKE